MMISKALIAVIVLVSAMCGATISAVVIPTTSDTACVPASEGNATFNRLPPERAGSKEY